MKVQTKTEGSFVRLQMVVLQVIGVDWPLNLELISHFILLDYTVRWQTLDFYG